MNKRHMMRITIVASLAALAPTPLLVALARSLVGPVEPISVFLGSIVATVFFGISGVAAVLTWERNEFKKLLLGTYVVKALLLIAAGLALGQTSVDRNAFGLSIVCSAVVYLIVQVVALGRRPSWR